MLWPMRVKGRLSRTGVFVNFRFQVCLFSFYDFGCSQFSNLGPKIIKMDKSEISVMDIDLGTYEVHRLKA